MMTALSVIRDVFQPEATLSRLYLFGELVGFVCEDVDRGLHQTDPIEHVHAIKVHGQTAIPDGRYRLHLYNSPKHGADTIELVAVPGFEHVQVHVGNWPKDTEGCLLPGTGRDLKQHMVLHSTDLVKQIRDAIVPRLRQGAELYIEISRENPPAALPPIG